jgi:hypothetical protein
MPRLIWSETALMDMTRLHDFLAAKNRAAAKRQFPKSVRA